MYRLSVLKSGYVRTPPRDRIADSFTHEPQAHSLSTSKSKVQQLCFIQSCQGLRKLHRDEGVELFQGHDIRLTTDFFMSQPLQRLCLQVTQVLRGLHSRNAPVLMLLVQRIVNGSVSYPLVLIQVFQLLRVTGPSNLFRSAVLDLDAGPLTLTGPRCQTRPRSIVEEVTPSVSHQPTSP